MEIFVPLVCSVLALTFLSLQNRITKYVSMLHDLRLISELCVGIIKI